MEFDIYSKFPLSRFFVFDRLSSGNVKTIKNNGLNKFIIGKNKKIINLDNDNSYICDDKIIIPLNTYCKKYDNEENAICYFGELISKFVLEFLNLHNISLEADIIDFDVMNKLYESIETDNKKINSIVVNKNTFNLLKKISALDIDICTHQEILDFGIYGNTFGKQIIVSDLIEDNVIFALNDPEYIGIISYCDIVKDNSFVYGKFGMALMSGNNIAKLKIKQK